MHEYEGVCVCEGELDFFQSPGVAMCNADG